MSGIPFQTGRMPWLRKPPHRARHRTGHATAQGMLERRACWGGGHAGVRARGRVVFWPPAAHRRRAGRAHTLSGAQLQAPGCFLASAAIPAVSLRQSIKFDVKKKYENACHGSDALFLNGVRELSSNTQCRICVNYSIDFSSVIPANHDSILIHSDPWPPLRMHLKKNL